MMMVTYEVYDGEEQMQGQMLFVLSLSPFSVYSDIDDASKRTRGYTKHSPL